jgi:Cu(I)/Ag(I) efflux system membrane fusion protein
MPLTLPTVKVLLNDDQMKTSISIYAIILFFLVSCSSGELKHEDKNAFYTCSMDPQVMEKKPGRCPICKMDLTRIIVDPNQDAEEIKLSDMQVKLANITSRPVHSVLFGKEKILNASLTENENLTESISTRMSGRIEKLYVQYVGQRIEKGSKLYDIYSEDLLNAQREYLLALENENADAKNGINYKSFVNAALNRLFLYGFTEVQLEKLKSSGHPSPLYSVMAPQGGVVTALNITQGDYVEDGMELFKIADLSSLWVEAQLFGNEILQVKNNTEVKISFPGFPGMSMHSKISFMSPEMLPGTRINLIRAEIPNADLRFQPGMLALLSFRNGAKKTIAVPSDALIMDEKMNTVWLQNKQGSFSPQMVKTGIQGADSIEIVSGISEGDTVVVSGVYLLNSEYITRKGNRFGQSHKH